MRRCARARLLACSLLPIIAGGVTTPASAATRRALLVGIDKYVVVDKGRGQTGLASTTPPSRGIWTDLEGAVNDVEAVRQVLIARFGFRPDNIHVLSNAEATRDRILAELNAWLVEPATPGDVSFFYYAGHGSQVRNSRSAEADKMDESLVPADASRGIADIRDKEFTRILDEALQKGAWVTVALDSCHSASMSRGLSSARVRSAAPDLRDVADPASPPSLESKGALVIAASQSHEVAVETSDESGQPHGLFSWALLKVLRSMPVDTPADRLFLSLRALMASAYVAQEPDLAATPARRHRGLFGENPGTARSGTVAAVRSIAPDGTVVLDGGRAAGIRTGCELRLLGAIADQSATIAVFEENGLTSSRARVVTGTAAAIKPAALFEVTRWASPNEPALRVSLGAISRSTRQAAEDADRVANAATKAGAVWTDDPTTEQTSPLAILRWSDAAWEISAEGRVITAPAEEMLVRRLPAAADGRPHVFLDVPLGDDVRALLQIGAGTANDAIELAGSANSADYALIGRRRGSAIEYAWMRPTINETAFKSTMPIRTDWVRVDPGRIADAARTLADQAVRLAAVRAWLSLESPPDQTVFPLHIALKNLATRTLTTTGPVREREEYSLALTFDESASAAIVPPRYVYVFAIDSDGTGTLLFPSPNGGSGENRFPLRDSSGHLSRDAIDLPARFTISAPLGTDTYVMLATGTPLGDPTVLEFGGVRSRGSASKVQATDPLSMLLSMTSTPTRSVKPTTPTDWTLERLVIQSVAAR